MAANTYFSFKKFTIDQNNVAMKVGTDGVLLGAWAKGGTRILDIGCGTGLISLMMAQRFPEADVVAIDIEPMACRQAVQNVENSIYRGRVEVINMSISEYYGMMPCGIFDSIVCNPPFFNNSLKSPDVRKSIAKHADSMPLDQLLDAVSHLIADEGQFSVVIPVSESERFDNEAIFHGFFKQRELFVKTTENKSPKRILIEYVKHPPVHFSSSTECICSNNGRSEWYDSLTKEFYIK